MPKRRADLARALTQRAGEDLTALRRWAGDEEIADSVLGFHAQQAIEKSLKAVLASRDVEFARTHDLKYLIELLEDEGLSPPVDVAEVVALTEYAVGLRYDDPAEVEEPLERLRVVELAEAVWDWSAGAAR